MNGAPLDPYEFDEFKQLVDRFGTRGLRFLIHKAFLQDGQTLDAIAPDRVRRVLANRGLFETRVCEFPLTEEERIESERRREDEEAKERTRLSQIKTERLRKERQQHIANFESTIPEDFYCLEVDTAPRPRQFKFVAEWYESPPMGKLGMILTGASGLGKTAAAWAMMLAGLKGGSVSGRPEFILSPTFFRIVKLKHVDRDARAEFNEMFNRLRNTELLVIDDLGSEKITEPAQEVIFELLSTRCDNHADTTITTNDSMEKLAARFSGNKAKMRRRLEQFFVTVNFDKV